MLIGVEVKVDQFQKRLARGWYRSCDRRVQSQCRKHILKSVGAVYVLLIFDYRP